jgi:hypothetical protein
MQAGSPFARYYKLYEAAYAIDGHHKDYLIRPIYQDDIAEF